MSRLKLNEAQLKARRRNVRKASEMIEGYQTGEEPLSRRMIRVRLKLYGFDTGEIREAISITPRYHKTDKCVDWMQQQFNGKLMMGRKVVAAGEKAGYSRMVIYRSLKSIAVLKKVSEYGKKREMWKFDWITERRNFEDDDA